MKKLMIGNICAICLLIGASGCGQTEEQSASSATNKTQEASSAGGGQAYVQDDVSQKDVLKVAEGSKDHTTLVTAIKAADLVNSLSNAGPFTVFAPTNAAFDALPAGTVEGLLKPEKQKDLANILQYHVAVGVFKEDMMQDGQKLGTASGPSLTIGKKNGKLTVNGANVLTSIQASNGIVYVIDKVLLPPAQ